MIPKDVQAFARPQTEEDRRRAAGSKGELGLGEGKAVNYNIFEPGERAKRAYLTFAGSARSQANLLNDSNPALSAARSKGVSPELLAQRQALQAGRAGMAKTRNAQMNDQMSRQFTAAQQNQDDALKRRFASMGMANSGAALGVQLKAAQDLEGQQADMRNQAYNQAGEQELQANAQELQGQLAAEEADAGRSEAQAAREQQVGLTGYQAELARRLYNTQTQNQFEEMNNQLDITRAQALLDQETTDFNKGVSQRGGGGGPCFITTAVCDFLGLPDDNIILNQFRKFRDEYMGGKHANEVAEYYTLAPILEPHIKGNRKVLSTILSEYLMPCFMLIEHGDNEEARVLYRLMVVELKQKYGVAHE